MFFCYIFLHSHGLSWFQEDPMTQKTFQLSDCVELQPRHSPLCLFSSSLSSSSSSSQFQLHCLFIEMIHSRPNVYCQRLGIYLSWCSFFASCSLFFLYRNTSTKIEMYTVSLSHMFVAWTLCSVVHWSDEADLLSISVKVMILWWRLTLYDILLST